MTYRLQNIFLCLLNLEAHLETCAVRFYQGVHKAWSVAPVSGRTVVLGCGGARFGLGDVKVSSVQWMHDSAWK